MYNFIIKDGILKKYTGVATRVIIPDGVTTIGYKAFQNCTSLTSIHISDGVTTIENSAFEGCTSLTSVYISDSVTTIGLIAFFYCPNLKKASLPEGIKIKGNFPAFPKTTKITYRKKAPVPVKNIPEKEASASITSDKNFLIKDNTLMAYLGSEEHVKILEGVKKIASSAFARCDFLFSVDIPDSVTEIHDCAFLMCPNLEKVSIPQNVKIGENIFYGCERLNTLSIRFQVGACGIFDKSAIDTMFQKL